MKSIQKIFIGLAVTGALGVAGASYAFDGPGPGAGKFRGDCMQDDDIGGMRGANLPAMVDKRLDRIRTELKITEAQQTAWQIFATKTKQQATEMQAMREKMRQGGAAPGASAEPVPAPERLEKGIEFMKQRTGHMEAELAALKELYAALTPEQRATADKLLGHPGGGQRGERMRRHRR